LPKLPEYYGIKRGYPRLRRYFGKFMAYLQLCRVFTLIAPFTAGLFGVLTPVRSISLNHLITATYVGVTLALSQAAGQCINQYADAELDKEIKGYRPIPSGLVSREEALGLSWLLAIFAIGRAFTISTFFGLTVLILIFFAVFYSLAPLSPRKVNPLLNTGWMALSRGFIPMFAVLSVYGDLNKAWQYSILAFLWVLGFQASKDVPDVQGDKKFGIKTIPNTWGIKGLIAIMGLCTALYVIFALKFEMYIMLLVAPLAVLAILTTKRRSKLTENTISWTCFYLGLSSIYLLMFIIERFTL